MHSSKKVFLRTLAVLLVVLGLSVLIILPYMESQERKTRKDLAGTVDYLVVGASHAQLGFVPSVLDQELGVNSYNLSSLLMPVTGRYFLLEKEIKRNPVKTVVLEVSYDTLAIDYNG